MTMVEFETLALEKVYVNPDMVIAVENDEYTYGIAEQPARCALIRTLGSGGYDSYRVNESVESVALRLASTVRS